MLVLCSLTLLIGYSVWMHLRHTSDSVEIKAGPILEQAKKAQTAHNDAQDAQPGTMAAPFPSYLPHSGAAKVETISVVMNKTPASDHVGGSVVGTRSQVLQQTFAVAGTVDLPFEVPAHAYNPKLHGTFRSFIQSGGKPSATPGDIDFVLLDENQFSAYLDGQPSEAVFSTDATHDQEVNANLPPTLNHPAKYHLIFRNVLPKSGKRVVQADFELEF